MSNLRKSVRLEYGTVIAKRGTRTRRVDKGKSGQAQKTAVSGGFGGGILSQILQADVGSFGGTEKRLWRSRRAIIAVLLIVVLTGLGGASQEKSAARVFYLRLSAVSSSRFNRIIPPASE